jgi:TRAP-type C4-dicarboxylate transport system permease small subunit
MLNRFNQIEEFISMLFLAVIVIFVFAAAIMRTIGYPIIWSVEIAQLLFIWVCMLGANQALRRDEHVGVDFLVRRLSTAARLKLDFCLYVVVACFLILLIVYGIQLSLLNPERTLGSVSLPYSLVTIAVPFGAGLMLFTTIRKLLYFAIQIKSTSTSIETSATTKGSST